MLIMPMRLVIAYLGYNYVVITYISYIFSSHIYNDCTNNLLIMNDAIESINGDITL